jgi:phospholipase/carboxylesterase
VSAFLDLSGPDFGPASGGRPRQLVILLHGLGADGSDLIELAPMWANLLPDARFVSPNAPFPCDMAPVGRQWFSLQSQSEETLLAGIRMAWPILDAFIDKELERSGLADRDLALVGFSQGTMMALFTAPRRTQRCAAVLGYSGMLIGAAELVREVVSRPPVLLVHGTADPIVPFPALAAAVEGLEAAGLSVEHHARPGLGHGIDPTGLELGGRFLEDWLAPAGEQR